MDYLLLQDFLVTYSLPTLIVAVIVSAVSLTLNKFFNRSPKLLKAYLPFLLAVLLYFIYDILFVEGDFSFKKEVFYGGILSGSLSAIISSAIKKISNGKPIGVSATVLLIEGILDGYIETHLLTKTAMDIELALSLEDSTKQEQQVVDTITYNCSSLTSDEIIRLAKLILGAVKQVKKS